MTDERKPKCFVIFPWAGEYLEIYNTAIKPAVEAAGFSVHVSGDYRDGQRLQVAVAERIAEADIVVADISHGGSEIYFELGIAEASHRQILALARAKEDLFSAAIRFAPEMLLLYDPSSVGIIALRERLTGILQSVNLRGPYLITPGPPHSVQRLQELEQENARLAQLIRERAEELTQLRALQPGADQLLSLQESMQATIRQFVQEESRSLNRSLAEAQLEVERLRSQNEVLNEAKRLIADLEGKMILNPYWPGRDIPLEEDLCFVLMPFSEPWSDDVWKTLQGIVTGSGFRCERADSSHGRNIMHDIWNGICRARYILADLTEANPNVTYEVGLADVLGKDVFMLAQSTKVPFDFLGSRLILYENSLAGARKLEGELKKRLKRPTRGRRKT